MCSVDAVARPSSSSLLIGALSEPSKGRPDGPGVAQASSTSRIGVERVRIARAISRRSQRRATRSITRCDDAAASAGGGDEAAAAPKVTEEDHRAIESSGLHAALAASQAAYEAPALAVEGAAIEVYVAAVDERLGAA